MKVVKIRHKWDNTIHCQYFCPGCGHAHAFSPLVHNWNEDRDRPTVTPSLRQSNPQNHHNCHSYITDGQIKFEMDCWHELKGKAVDLPEFDIALLDLAHIEII